MDPAPIWSDLKTFPSQEFRDRVDLLVAGYPCQPFSAAGKRLGTEDPRHLWPHIAGSIRVIRPRFCFFENVEGHISLGLREVIGELEEIGYQTAWGIFSAREVGAPHQRKRVFILAHSSSHGHDGWPIQDGVCGRSVSQLPQPLQGGCAEVWSEVEGRSNNACELADSQCAGLERLYNWHTPSEQTEFVGADAWASGERSAWPSRPGQPQHGWEPPRVVGNSESEQSSSRDHRGQQGSLGEQEQVQLGGGDCGALREINGQAQPPLGGNPDGTSDWMDYAELYTTCDNRTDELRLLGNGVVPATAERAFRTLIKELL